MNYERIECLVLSCTDSERLRILLSRRLARARVLLPLLKSGRELDARASSAQQVRRTTSTYLTFCAFGLGPKIGVFIICITSITYVPIPMFPGQDDNKLFLPGYSIFLPGN